MNPTLKIGQKIDSVFKGDVCTIINIEYSKTGIPLYVFEDIDGNEYHLMYNEIENNKPKNFTQLYNKHMQPN
jgi:hypothetical protein